jgi:CDP-diacylglycerol--serine O-phosphatidyltransferase
VDFVGIVKELKIKDIVTLLGTSCGIFSIFLSIDGRFLWMAATFIYFSMVFDLLDGFVAMLTKQANDLGRVLDSLSDTICFGVAPAILIYRYFTIPIGPYFPFVMVIFCGLFVIGVILRLTWFTVNQTLGYEGVTAPITAAVILTLFYIDMFYPSFPDSGPVLGQILLYYIPISMFVLPYLNISKFFVYDQDIRVRNKRNIILLLTIFMIFGGTASILAYFDQTRTGPYIYGLCVAILVMLYSYIGIGVFNYLKRKKESKK